MSCYILQYVLHLKCMWVRIRPILFKLVYKSFFTTQIDNKQIFYFQQTSDLFNGVNRLCECKLLIKFM